MARVRSTSIKLAAANATAVCASQTPGGAGSLVINGSAASGGVATLDAARRILFTAVADESAHTFTITGTDRAGNVQYESLVGPNATTAGSLLDYLTVTKITISAVATGAITVGTSAVASTAWLPLDTNCAVFNASAAVSFGGAAGSVTLEVCVDAVDRAAFEMAPGGSGDMSAANVATSAFVQPAVFTVGGALTSNTLTQIGYPVRAVRVTVASGATATPVRLVVMQAGL